MCSPSNGSASNRGARAASRSPTKWGAEELAAGLSAKMVDLLVTDKEVTGLVIKGVKPTDAPKPRWAVVGKVFSPRKLIIGVQERAMQRIWRLHRPAQFKVIGDNRFVVRFISEGDWKHAMKNGSWQFDFHAVLL